MLGTLVYSFFPPHGATASSGPRPLHCRGFTITFRHTTLGRLLSGRVMGPTQRPLPDNTQRSQEANIHVLGGIWTHNASKRAVADPRLRPRGHWNRPCIHYVGINGWLWYASSINWVSKPLSTYTYCTRAHRLWRKEYMTRGLHSLNSYTVGRHDHSELYYHV
jgi:hypothetical protein